MKTCFKCEYCGQLFDTPLKCAKHEEFCPAWKDRAVTLFADPGCPERGVTRKENEGGPILTRNGDKESGMAVKEIGRYALLLEYRPGIQGKSLRHDARGASWTADRRA